MLGGLQMAIRDIRRIGPAVAVLFVLTRATPAQVVPPAPGAAAAAGAAGVVERALGAHGARWAAGEIADWVAEGKITYFNASGPHVTFDVTVSRKGKSQVQ